MQGIGQRRDRTWAMAKQTNKNKGKLVMNQCKNHFNINVQILKNQEL